jgi:hypothetical protein
VLGQSDLIANVPERFPPCVTRHFALTTRAFPLAIEGSVIQQLWHARMHKDPWHQWLRGLLAQNLVDQ